MQSFLQPGKLLKSFRYALKGLITAWKREQNFRIQGVISVAVILFMILVRVRIWEAVALLLAIGSVLILELINTIFEALVDILKPRMHHYVAIIKDLMAAAVFLASLGAAIIGLLILGPYIWPGS